MGKQIILAAFALATERRSGIFAEGCGACALWRCGSFVWPLQPLVLSRHSGSGSTFHSGVKRYRAAPMAVV